MSPITMDTFLDAVTLLVVAGMALGVALEGKGWLTDLRAWWHDR